MFQGGFVGIETHLFSISDQGEWELSKIFYLKDDNSNQILETSLKSSKIRLEFVKSSDFFGRIVIYNLHCHF